jgi:hypothetical protein
MIVRGFILLMTALAASLAATGEGLAQVAPNSLRSDPFSALVGKRRPLEEREAASAKVERYVVATDDRVFLFQDDGEIGRLKYLCGDGDRQIDCVIDEGNPAEEIHLVSSTRVSRGDVVWRNGEGQMLLRIAAYGGATVYFPGIPRGQAASKSFGEDPPLTLSPLTIEAARARANQATAIVSAEVGAPIPFDVGNPAPDASGGATVLGDAVVRAAKGVRKVARDPTGAGVIASRIRRVEFRRADAAGLGLEKGVLVVGYDPENDAAGRPSSARIARFLENSL